MGEIGLYSVTWTQYYWFESASRGVSIKLKDKIKGWYTLQLKKPVTFWLRRTRKILILVLKAIAYSNNKTSKHILEENLFAKY